MDKRGLSKIVKSIDSGVSLNRGEIYEQERQLGEMSEIILRLESYADIFSDFDPRPYSKRALSDDFLMELKKASADKKEKIELRLTPINDSQDKALEHTVRNRLRSHFARHFDLIGQEIRALRTRGTLMVIIGALLLTISSYFNFALSSNGFFYHFLLTLLEPAGWFTAWEGMYLVVFSPAEKKKEYEFYRKMKDSNIVFAPK